MLILPIIHKKLLVLIVIITLILISIWIFIYRSIQKELSPAPISTSMFQLSTVPAPATESTNTIAKMKIYRNTEWGFEFQYLEDWAVEENYFKNYYSKFNLKVTPVKERHTKEPVAINIVLPEFADSSFRSVEKTTSEIIINGVSGIKYEYEFGGRQEIAIILPLGDLRIIIGTDDKQYYEDVFNQILTSFKFLK